MDIAGKVFIVTGGASGLGEGTARMLSANGGTVVIADMQVEKGEAIAKDIGGTFVKCDVSSEADGQAVVARAVSMGKLMGLINCAGIAPGEKTVGKNGAHALSTFSKCITVNLVGSFNMIRLAADAMCKNEPEATGERKQSFHRHLVAEKFTWAMAFRCRRFQQRVFQTVRRARLNRNASPIGKKPTVWISKTGGARDLASQMRHQPFEIYGRLGRCN